MYGLSASVVRDCKNNVHTVKAILWAMFSSRIDTLYRMVLDFIFLRQSQTQTVVCFTMSMYVGCIHNIIMKFMIVGMGTLYATIPERIFTDH